MSDRESAKSGSRFAFGENWTRFLAEVNDDRIALAQESLRSMLAVSDLEGKRFLDIGSGSGLFSLAARRLGASVRSFDYDPQSVACTEELRRRYFPHDSAWEVERGSVLDEEYLDSLGTWDMVYAWGVLHHTGNMWQALANVCALVEPRGKLFLAVYNDQGRASKSWRAVKRAYNRLPAALRGLVFWPAMLRLWGPTTLRDLFRGRPFYTWRNYARTSLRGMSPWRDAVDWIGGLPFEVARPEQVVDFYCDRGFVLDQLKTCGRGIGCNEFVFERTI